MIEWTTLNDWQADWLQPSADAVQKRLRFYERQSSITKGQLVTGIHQVREGHARLLDRHCHGLRDQLAPDSGVGSTPRMRHLLNVARERLEGDAVEDQVWFEAISRFDQAIGVTRVEQVQPMEHVDLTMERLIRLFTDHLFIGKLENIDFYVYHDPSREYIVPQENVGFGRLLNRPGMVRRKMPRRCRRVQDNGIAFLLHRLKDPFDTWLKIQRQLKVGKVDDPYDVTDRAALTLVSPSVEESLALGYRVLALLERHGGFITEPLSHNYDTDEATDQANSASSSDHKFAKGSVFWNDLEIELQFITFADYFSSLRALNDRNHALYKLKQAVGSHLPLLWPTQLYGVDWKNPQVRGLLRSWKIAQLGWAVHEFHSAA